jgi:N-acetylneuraminic acid mutarotase
VTYTLPFYFNYYGTNYNVVHISTNGNLHFGPPNDYWPGASGDCVPSSSPYVPQAMIAPLFYDFVVSNTLPERGVYTDIAGTAPNRTYIVEWRNVSSYSDSSVHATFEALLKESGQILFQYHDFNGAGVTGADGVIGIQDSTGTIGLPYGCYTDVLIQGRAILYQVPQAVFLEPGDTTSGGAPGSSVTYTQTLLNQTGQDNAFVLSTLGDNWSASVSPTNTGTIPRGGSLQVHVRVAIPSGVPLGASDRAVLTATSTLSTHTFSDTVVLTTTASTLGADFSPPGQTLAGNYGAPVTYTLSLTNRSGQTNHFQLSPSGATWPTVITPTTTADMGADASVPVTVSVLVPANASLGARDVVSVTAVAQLPSPGQFYGVTVLTTTAGIWLRQSNMPLGRSRGAAAAFPANGHVYVIGGEYNNGNMDMPIEEYDPLVDTWTPRRNLQLGVINAGAAVIGNAIYVPGGYSTAQPAGTRTLLQVYYPLENRVDVITTDPLPAPRFGAGVAAYNGKLYVIGGTDDTLVAKNTVFEYDPSRPAGSRWQTKAPMPTARAYLGAAAVDGLIYAAGGVPGGLTDLATLEAYNPATDTWSTRHPMSIGRGGLAVVGVDTSMPGCGGYLYALGGGWINFTATAERYNPGTDSWQPISSLTAARRTLAAAYSPETYSLLAMGGWDGAYDSRTEEVACSGGLVPPTATPTVPVTPSPTMTPLPNCTIRFTDVPPGSTFYSYATCLACKGILSGYPCGGVGEPCDPSSNPYFRPNNNVTRGQLAKIVSQSAGLTDPVSGQTFQDVPPGSTFYTYIERLVAHNVMSGYPCGGAGEPCLPPNNLPYFRTNNNATRGQISKIISNAAGFSDLQSTQLFQDEPVGSTYFTYTARLASRSIMSGYPCGTSNEPCVPPDDLPYFRSNNNATRGQVSKIDANTFYPGCNPGPN